MPTSIRFDRESIQLLRVAAAILNQRSYQTYVKAIAIAHAELTIRSTIPTMSVKGLDKKVVFDDVE